MYYEPLRPNRIADVPERYEFSHGESSVCVYDIVTLDLVKEIPVGTKPDCHATSPDNRFLYIACSEGVYCISQETLEVVKVIPIVMAHAVNVLPDGSALLVHDICGGVSLLREITDMSRIHIHSRRQVIPNGKLRCEIGKKGSFLENGRYYLCCGWHQSNLYLFDLEDDFSFEIFMESDDRLFNGDDLVVTADHKKAYCACCQKGRKRSHVAVIDMEQRKIRKIIPTGVGTCGLTMTVDGRYLVASNGGDDSISVIDMATDTVVNTPCAGKGFEELGITGYIQGISCGKDNSIYVYGSASNGVIVRFYDIVEHNRYTISCRGEKYVSEEGRIIGARPAGVLSRVMMEKIQQIVPRQLCKEEFLKVVYCISGNGSCRLAGREYPISQGSFLFVLPGQSHSMIPGQSLTLINVYLEPESFRGEFVEVVNKEYAEQCIQFQKEEMSKVEYLLHLMLQEWEQKDFGYQAVLKAGVQTLLSWFLREIQKESHQLLLGYLQDVICYIDTHYTEKIVLKDLAAQGFYHPDYLSNQLKRQFGKSFSEYVKEKRMLHASKLLQTTELSVNEVMVQSGYSDSKLFYKHFKERYGTAPGNYRKS